MLSKICPVCEVRVIDGTVLFSAGKPGTPERLYQRVCRHALERGKQGCINDLVDHAKITPADDFGLPQNEQDRYDKIIRGEI